VYLFFLQYQIFKTRLALVPFVTAKAQSFPIAMLFLIAYLIHKLTYFLTLISFLTLFFVLIRIE
jgi:hypothetical protein